MPRKKKIFQNNPSHFFAESPVAKPLLDERTLINFKNLENIKLELAALQELNQQSPSFMIEEQITATQQELMDIRVDLLKQTECYGKKALQFESLLLLAMAQHTALYPILAFLQMQPLDLIQAGAAGFKNILQAIDRVLPINLNDLASLEDNDFFNDVLLKEDITFKNVAKNFLLAIAALKLAKNEIARQEKEHQVLYDVLKNSYETELRANASLPSAARAVSIKYLEQLQKTKHLQQEAAKQITQVDEYQDTIRQLIKVISDYEFSVDNFFNPPYKR